MNENTLDFLYNIAMIIIFITALSLFFILLPRSETTVALLKESMSRDKAIYESNSSVEEYTVSGAEIIGNIHLGLSTDIQVDSIYIPLDIDATSFDYSFISPESRYEVWNYIGLDGKLDWIVYKRK